VTTKKGPLNQISPHLKLPVNGRAPPLIQAPKVPFPRHYTPTLVNYRVLGVIEDWRKFKQLENDRKGETQRECVELAKKLTMTVRTALDEEKEALDDPELAELLNDDFLLHYQKQRIEQMMAQTNLTKKFGE